MYIRKTKVSLGTWKSSNAVLTRTADYHEAIFLQQKRKNKKILFIYLQSNFIEFKKLNEKLD